MTVNKVMFAGITTLRPTALPVLDIRRYSRSIFHVDSKFWSYFFEMMHHGIVTDITMKFMGTYCDLVSCESFLVVFVTSQNNDAEFQNNVKIWNLHEKWIWDSYDWKNNCWDTNTLSCEPRGIPK